MRALPSANQTMIRKATASILAAAILSSAIAAGAQDRAGLKAMQQGLDAITPAAISEHTKKLASDEFEGRGPGTRGETLTVEYLVDRFKKTGAKPGNPNGTYVQKVPLVGYRTVPRLSFEAGGKVESLKFLDDFVHDYPALRPSAALNGAAVVFAGYGVVAPQYGWDDYAGVDVRGKVVIVLSGEPSRPDPKDPKKLDESFFKGDTRTYYSTRESKYEIASKRGAAGILVVYDPSTARTFSIFQAFAKMEGFALKPARPNEEPVISGLITKAAAERVLSSAGLNFAELQSAASRPNYLAVVTKARATVAVASVIRNVTSHNVVARVEGSDPRLKNEYIIYSSHWDHLGKDPTLTGDQIYNGAIDDAAGTAQLIEIARGFVNLPRKPKRSILFIATTAEEKGYLGARHYTRNPLFPISNTLANINLDGANLFGVTADLISTGYGLSFLDETLAEAARLQGRTFVRASLDNGGLYFASDQIEFAKAGIPAVFPFSGSNYVGKPKDYGDKLWEAYGDKDYHKVSDEFKPDWDFSGAAEDARWLLIAGYNVAQSNIRPTWKSGSEFRRSR